MIGWIVSLLGCSPVHVWLGGDVHWGDGRPDFEAVVPVGVGVVNVEGPVADAPLAPPRLWNAPAGIEGLRRGGVVFAGIVNNHTADADAPPEVTAAELASYGLMAVGRLRPDASPLDGVATFGKLHVSQHDLSGGFTDAVDADLRAIGALEGRWVATFHVVGDGYLPSPALREAVTHAVFHGADVVAVHGTHLVGPVERRDGAVIAWGLGNLAFACDCTRETEAILLDVSFPDLRARVIPIRAGLDGAPARPHEDPAAVYALLAGLGSSPIAADGSF